MRVISTSLRISWATYPHNVRLGLAASIFLNAGVVVLYAINIFFTQRIVRARLPHIGWSKAFFAFVPLGIILIVLGILMIVVVVVQSYFTLNPNTLRIDHDVQLCVLTIFTVIAFIPIPVVLLALILPRRQHMDKFGAGSFRTKVLLVLCTSSLLTLGAAFRCGISFLPPVSILEAVPWYDSKACFYIFTFTIEVIVLYLYLVVRVDRRFHVPDKSSGPTRQ